jgi:hypothetical protein
MSWPPVICSGLRYRSAFASGSRTDRARPAPMHAGGCAFYSLVWQISFLPILFVDLLATRILKLKWSDFPVWILFWATLPLALFPVALTYRSPWSSAPWIFRSSSARRAICLGSPRRVHHAPTGFDLRCRDRRHALQQPVCGTLCATYCRGIGLVLLVGAGSQRTARWIGRRFFREAHAARAEEFFRRRARRHRKRTVSNRRLIHRLCPAARRHDRGRRQVFGMTITRDWYWRVDGLTESPPAARVCRCGSPSRRW